MKNLLFALSFSFFVITGFSQITYFKDAFGNSVTKDQCDSTISTFSKDALVNTFEKDQFGNTKQTQSQDIYGNTVVND